MERKQRLVRVDRGFHIRNVDFELVFLFAGVKNTAAANAERVAADEGIHSFLVIWGLNY